MKKWERIFFLTCVILLVGIVPVGAQQGNDPVSFIGMRLHELISRFGVPQSVFASRGGNHWQDDVVFVYNEGDFYIYRDRVWQVGVKSLLNMKIGDAKAVALLVLGEDARDMGDYLLYPISDNAWPISLRVNFNAGKITAIFIYRTDY
ncbi:MAG: hypothetical protein FWD36_00740 [Treponema sp.]|nr:hypothetical protein [Treponema sp.]